MIDVVEAIVYNRDLHARAGETSVVQRNDANLGQLFEGRSVEILPNVQQRGSLRACRQRRRWPPPAQVAHHSQLAHELQQANLALDLGRDPDTNRVEPARADAHFSA